MSQQYVSALTSRKGRVGNESTMAWYCYSFSPLNIAKCDTIRPGNELLAIRQGSCQVPLLS